MIYTVGWNALAPHPALHPGSTVAYLSRYRRVTVAPVSRYRVFGRTLPVLFRRNRPENAPTTS